MMKLNHLFLFVICSFIASCTQENEISSMNSQNWEQRSVDPAGLASLESGKTYLSVYSQIYSQNEHKTHDLTVTVSMRNPNPDDTVYIHKAEYFDNSGAPIRTYFDKPIFLAPMETAEIIIDERDKTGGTGASFLFDWNKTPGTNSPVFEAVMISTYGQQGLSFTTQGVELR